MQRHFGKVTPHEQQEIFDIIYRKSNTINDMINTLFDYAKLGTEQYKPNFAQIDICTLVRDIIAENYCDIEEHDIELEIEIPDDEIVINADKTELKRAITNLIVNIYKHNPGGIKAKISVRKENDKAEIRIADSGKTLPDDIDIFEPFVTENSARTTGHGTGLGLAVTKRIIERHDGELSVSTNEDEYTKMFVMGKQAIANKLNEMGITTKNDRLWTPESIRRILKNEKYCGDLLLQKTFRENHLTKRKMENQGQLPQYYVEDAHEPIIDREIFQQAQELLMEQQKFSPKKSCDTIYPFRSMITCVCCGKNYRRKTTVTGVVWICATYNNRGKKFCPTSKQIPEDTLYKVCCEALKINEFDEEFFQKQIKQILVPEPNLLTFIFHAGHKETVRWTDRSRSESWTPEMREKAAQNTREKRWKSCQK